MGSKNSAPVSTAKQEARWRAESDLRTLIEAKAIMADPDRHKKALAVAKEEAANLKQVQADK